MKFRKKKTNETTPVEQALPEPTGIRARGPWDRSERTPESTAAYVDFGSFLVRPISGMQIQIAGQEETNVAVLLNLNGSILELRVVAASRHGDDWSAMVPRVINEVEGRGSKASQREGVFGTEVVTEFPGKDENGKSVTQPARFIGVAGPRWLLRATLIGTAAVEPDDNNDLIQVIRDVVVVRGPEARILGELLPIDIPSQMQGQET